LKKVSITAKEVAAPALAPKEPEVVPEAIAAEPVTQIEQISLAAQAQSEQEQLHKQGQVFAVQTQDEN